MSNGASQSIRESIEAGILMAAEKHTQDEWYRMKLRNVLQLPHQHSELLPKHGVVSSPLVDSLCDLYEKAKEAVNGVTVLRHLCPSLFWKISRCGIRSK